MNPTPYYEKSLFERPSKDDERYMEWTAGLPERADDTPYHCGPHSIRSMEAAWRMAGKPKAILEVGFCLGHSASIWFGLGAKQVHSIENSQRPQTLIARDFVKAKHPHFALFEGTSLDFPASTMQGNFGLMFIDGGHEFDAVSADIALGLELKIPYLLFDDFFPKWGPGTQPAIEAAKLIPVAIFGNQALCVPSFK